MRFNTEQAEAFHRTTVEAAAVAAALAAHAPMLEECRRSKEIQQQQDALAHDVGEAAVEEVDTDGYRYAHLSFLKMCTWQDGQTLVDGKVSKINKRKNILTYGFLG